MVIKRINLSKYILYVIYHKLKFVMCTQRAEILVIEFFKFHYFILNLF